MRVVFEEAATAEYLEAIEFYGPGRGAEFVKAIDTALRQLLLLPHSAPKLRGFGRPVEVRHKLVADFAYRIVYVAHGDELRVYAVAHTSREPGYWLDRLDSIAKR